MNTTSRSPQATGGIFAINQNLAAATGRGDITVARIRELAESDPAFALAIVEAHDRQRAASERAATDRGADARRLHQQRMAAQRGRLTTSAR